MMKIVRICFAGALLMAASCTTVNNFTLVKNGKPVCCIILPDNAGVVEKHAAVELAGFLAKISGGPAPVISTSPVAGLYPVYLVTSNAPGLNAEGFMLKAAPDGLRIIGKEPIGVLYGVYEILKAYGGMRWITPGEDGEYFTRKPTVAVPEQSTIHNPSFRWRRLFCGCCNVNSLTTNTWDWMVRNNMRVTDVNSTGYRRYRVSGEPRVLGKILEERGALADEIGGFSQLLAGIGISRDYKDGYAYLAKMFEEHPERFPLINGKRVPNSGDQRYQPCTTNPDVIDIMRNNIDAYLSAKMKPGDEYELFNDDGQGWCQCENCRKLDPPEEKQLGFVSTRFWTFANQLLGPLVKKYPEIKLGAIAYQNFQRIPMGVKPDKNLFVLKAYNRRCYRHNLDDTNCPVNQVFYEYFKEWSALGNPSFTWDQIDASARAYMPTEHTFINQLKTLHKLGVNGARPVLEPPDGTYGKPYDGTMTQDCWYGMWQTLYLSAQFLWNIEGDYDALYEEAGSLYYGKAWPVMKEYRALMVTTVTNDPGCFGWGHGSPIGRLLTQPGVHDKMNEFLNKAEQAVKDDPKALLHVQRDRTFFAQVWEKALKTYLENYRELRVYRHATPITIDGVLDDPDWKNADIITGFKSALDGAPQEIAQTFVKVVYDRDFLYFGIEAMEPTPEKMLTEIGQRDGELWLDSTLEIFITHPDLDGNYFQLIFNAKGILYDAFNRRAQKAPDLAFNSQAEIKTKILKDRWIAEVRIPTAPLGMQAADGQVWRINVARARVLTDDYRETSSLSGGVFHGVDYYPTVSFAGARAMDMTYLSFAEKDTRIWKNGGFNEVFKRDHDKVLGWKLGENELLPKDWILQSQTGELAMVQNTESDYCLDLKKGALFQFNCGMEKDYAINMRLKGHGAVKVFIYNYPRRGNTDQIDAEIRKRDGFPTSKRLGEVRVNSDEWKNYKFTYSKGDATHISALAVEHKEGEVMIDDVYMTPSKTMENAGEETGK